MTETKSELNREAAFKTALQTRNFEIGLFWQRSLFFWGFIGAAFIAYSDVMKEPKHDDDIAVAIACFGLICSFIWTLANRGSKYWQESWENKLESYEYKAIGDRLFRDKYRPARRSWLGNWSLGWHFSVTRLAVILSDYTVLVWLVLALRATPGPVMLQNINGAPWILTGSLTYAAVWVFSAMSSNSSTNAIEDK